MENRIVQAIILLLTCTSAACVVARAPSDDTDVADDTGGCEPPAEGPSALLRSRISKLEAQNTALSQRLTEVESRFIDADRTLNVPGDYADINVALEALDGKVISSAATVTVQVADGTYSYGTRVEVHHANGDRIQIVGNTSDPAAVVLQFSSGTDGIVLANGAELALLAGMTIMGDSSCASLGADGVYVGPNASLGLGPLVIEDFGANGLKVDGGYAQGSGDAGWFSASSNCENGVVASRAGLIEIPYPILTGNSVGVAAVHNGWASTYGASVYGSGTDGMLASFGGLIVAQTSTSSHNLQHGFQANFDGTLYADGSTAAGNVGDGFVAYAGSAMSAANGAKATGNGNYGYYAAEDSRLFAGESEAEENMIGYISDTSSFINAENSTAIDSPIGYLTLQGGQLYAFGADATTCEVPSSPATSSETTDGAYMWW